MVEYYVLGSPCVDRDRVGMYILWVGTDQCIVGRFPGSCSAEIETFCCRNTPPHKVSSHYVCGYYLRGIVDSKGNAYWAITESELKENALERSHFKHGCKTPAQFLVLAKQFVKDCAVYHRKSLPGANTPWKLHTALLALILICSVFLLLLILRICNQIYLPRPTL